MAIPESISLLPAKARVFVTVRILPSTAFTHLSSLHADRDGSTETESHPRRSDRMLRDALDG
jgi:hypothetical protein